MYMRYLCGPVNFSSLLVKSVVNLRIARRITPAAIRPGSGWLFFFLLQIILACPSVIGCSLPGQAYAGPLFKFLARKFNLGLFSK